MKDKRKFCLKCLPPHFGRQFNILNLVNDVGKYFQGHYTKRHQFYFLRQQIMQLDHHIHWSKKGNRLNKQIPMIQLTPVLRDYLTPSNTPCSIKK